MAMKPCLGILFFSLFLAPLPPLAAATPDKESPIPPLTPNPALIKAAQPQAAARPQKTARVVEESIAISSDGLLSFKIKTNNFPVNSFVEAVLESGTVLEVGSGDYTDPKFRHWKSNALKVQANNTVQFMFPLNGLQDGYVRIRIPKYEEPGVAPSILTFPIQRNMQRVVEPCGRGTGGGACKVLHGYGGAGRG
jgi:hypothetical protein